MSSYVLKDGLKAIATAIQNSKVDYSKLIMAILERGVDITPHSTGSELQFGFKIKLRK